MENPRQTLNPPTNPPQVVEPLKIQPFIFKHEKFGTLRGLTLNGKPWFVGNDATDALGYKDAVNALKAHVPDKFKCVINAKMLQQMASESKGGDSPLFEFDSPRGLTFINEAGLYKLILRSKLPAAEEFSDWVCEEILPSIRQYGYYSLIAETAPVVKHEKNQNRVEGQLTDASVYLAHMITDRNYIKIGQSHNPKARVSQMKGMDREDIHKTSSMAREIARAFEQTSLDILSPFKLKGEFFYFDYEMTKRIIKALEEFAVKLWGIFQKKNSRTSA